MQNISVVEHTAYFSLSGAVRDVEPGYIVWKAHRVPQRFYSCLSNVVNNELSE